MAPQQLNVTAWERFLDVVPTSKELDLDAKARLRDYLRNGADIHLNSKVVPDQLPFRPCRNLPTAQSAEQKVKLLEDFKKEVELGRRAGPFIDLPNPHLQCSPLGTVTKKHSKKLRTILHLSYPRDGSGSSVNSGIEELECELMRFGDAVGEIVRRGRGCQLSKFDIKDAFRLIRVRPDQQTLLGMKFMGWYFVELALPFGLKSAPALFEMFSTAIDKFIQHAGVETVFHYLDDFLVVSGISQAEDEYRTVLRVFSELGVELAQEKLAAPSTRIEFLGLVLDSDSMMIELPEDKLSRYRVTIGRLRLNREATLDELLQMVGVLVYSAMVIQHGRSFYYHIIQMVKEAKRLHTEGAPFSLKFPLSAAALRELEWWALFIVEWNGKCMIAPSICHFEPPARHRLFTDACRTGMGAWFDECEYAAHVWDAVELARAQRKKTLSMPYLELLALTHGVGVWREKLRGRALIIQTDCEVVVEVFKKGYSRDGNMMLLLRQLALFTCTCNIFIHVCHIPGVDNVVADCLSRLTQCASDSVVDFTAFFELQEVKEAAKKGALLARREVTPFPSLSWNKLARNSKSALSL